MSKNNIILIGMPGSGKSTLGVVLAKKIGYSFIDSDIVIQDTYKKTLEQLIEENGDAGFIQIENAYKVCYEMINEHPDIQALYVSWDRPALLAIKALKALNRTDIAVFTTDLDFEIAEEMNQGFVKGLSTQRPYDQGKAAALAVAKSLVSDNVPKYIGVQPYVVHEKQLKRAWKDIFFEALPEELGEKQMGQ